MTHMPPPIAAHNLVQEFYGKPPRELYATLCALFSVRVNTELARGLPQDAMQLAVLDLSTNLVGTRGIKPVMSLVAACPNVHTLILRDNHLTNAAVSVAVSMLDGVRHLRVLDISSNPLITSASSKALSTFVRMNPNIRSLPVHNTGMSLAHQRSLTRLAEANAALADPERTEKISEADQRRHEQSTASSVEKRRMPNSPLFFSTRHGVVPISLVFQLASDSRALLESGARAPTGGVQPRVYMGLELLAEACATQPSQA